MHGVVVGGENQKSERKGTLGEYSSAKTLTQHDEICFSGSTPLSYTSFRLVASLVMNNFYGVISATITEATPQAALCS